jgi:hypothetical protein
MPDTPLEYVQAKIDAHEKRCQAQIDSRMSEFRSGINDLRGDVNKVSVIASATDERTRQHEGTLLRVEARQNEANRWAIATTIGIVIMLFGMIVTLLKEFLK